MTLQILAAIDVACRYTCLCPVVLRIKASTLCDRILVVEVMPFSLEITREVLVDGLWSWKDRGDESDLDSTERMILAKGY